MLGTNYVILGLGQFWLPRFGIILCIAVLSARDVQAATYTTPRALNVGDTYELVRDGWYSPAGGSAYEGDVIPKTDVNDDVGRDNPYYRRHNVTRAWPTGTGYWFTDADPHEGEPDPADPQWVDYVPPFQVLGAGRYAIGAGYRWAASRASYPAVYEVHHALGTNVILRSQRLGAANVTIVSYGLGEFEMAPGTFVRVVDTGTESITFGNMRFRLVAPLPRLQILRTHDLLMVRWPTNATPFQLESTTELGDAAWWVPVEGIPAQEENEMRLTLPLVSDAQYFRLRADPVP